MITLPLFALLPALAGASTDSIAPDQTNISTQTAAEFMKGVRIGWNVGNSLEAGNTSNGVFVPSETAWGNPMVTQQLIDSVKAAGFNAIRLPVAWSVFSDKTTWTIQTSWLDRAETVANYALNRGMYVVMNEHWDGGWLQPTAASKDSCNKRLAAIWKQVAIRFRDYGDHLIFAGTNEVMVTDNYSAPGTEYLSAQQSYLQTFVNTVRSTGGRNAYRYLAVQSFNTNIDYAYDLMTLPTDRVANRLMVEVHFYDPYEFTLDASNTTVTQWGASGATSKKATWDSDESHVDAQFAKVKSKFIDKGVPAILGEYAAILKNTSDNPPFRMAWDKYITQAAIKVGMHPFYWDPGFTTTGSSGLFDRSTGKEAYSDVIKAMMSVAPEVTTSVMPKTSLGNGLFRSGDKVARDDRAEIRLYDLHGRWIRTSSIEEGRSVLDLHGLESGVFVARSGADSKAIVAK